jgi:hypothetical protein
MESQQQTLMFERKYIAGTVSELRERARRLDDAVEWSDSIADTTQHDSERRIISATLAAINAEYGPSYFDDSASTQVPSQQVELQPTPHLFTALIFNKSNNGYEVNAIYVAAMNSKQAEDVVNTYPSDMFGLECHRFITTDEFMSAHPINSYTLEAEGHKRDVLSEEQLQRWIHVQTTATQDAPATFRRF